MSMTCSASNYNVGHQFLRCSTRTFPPLHPSAWSSRAQTSTIRPYCSIMKQQPNSKSFSSTAKKELKGSPAKASLRDRLAEMANGPFIRWYAPGAVFLGTLMLLDAAYSGDWSRIGVLTKDEEVALQGLVPFEAVGHSAAAVAAALVSSRRGEDWVPRALKAFFGGIVTLIEVVLVPSNVSSK